MSIADELVLLANTKENLRVSLGLSKDVPFSQYASHIPFYAKSGTVFDFVNNQYSKDQLPVNLSDISDFTRLSAATMWSEDGSVIEVDVDVPRISDEGLLIEPQRTNLATWALSPDKWYASSPKVAFEYFQNIDGKNTGVLSTINSSLFSSEWPIIQFAVDDDVNKYTVTNYGNYVSGSITPSFTAVVYNVTAAKNLQNFILSDTSNTFPVSAVINSDLMMLQASWNKPSNWSNSYPLRVFLGQKGFPVGAKLKSGARQVEAGAASSLIKTSASPVTRSPDILNIPLLPTQTITGDWDAGVTYSLAGGIATFTGHGYIRNITVEAL